MKQAKQAKVAAAAEQDESAPIRGAAAAVVRNMTASLEVPTATSVRAVPAKLIADNRIVINNFLKRNRGGKVSFTHLIGYAIIRAVNDYPAMNRHFAAADGKPTIVTPAHTNLGLAIDLPGRNGQRASGGSADPGHREDDVHPVLVGLRGRGAQGPQG